MAKNFRLGILLQHPPNKLLEALPLGAREIVLWCPRSLIGQTSYHTDAKGIRIVSLDMRSDRVVRLTAVLYPAITTDDIVISDITPSLRLVPCSDFLRPDVLNGSRCGAVDHNVVRFLSCHCFQPLTDELLHPRKL